MDSMNDVKDADRKSQSSIVHNFMSSTTAHGLPRAFEGRSLWLSLFWVLLFCSAIAVSIWQIGLLVKHFIARDVSVKTEIVTAPQMPFPSVSICNTNKLRKSAVSESAYSELLTVDTGIAEPYFGDCLEGDFQCTNGGCVKTYLKCDGIDNCGDKSDESGCVYGDCDAGKIKCVSGSPTGACIDEKFKCDREFNCYEGEDENDCVCKRKEFKCGDTGRCIDGTLQCDDSIDCNDGSDEEECGAECPSDHLECNGLCIPPEWLCDNLQDCPDGTDEEDCGDPEIQICSPFEFACDLYQCIPIYWECDGVPDCINGKDEDNCPLQAAPQSFGFVTCSEDEYQCDLFTCIPLNQKCNGIVDCALEGDEDDCPEMTGWMTTQGSNKTATYQPVAKDLLKIYTALSYDITLYEDFVDNHYHDHQFGRVKSEDPPDWPGFITYSSTPDYSDLENVLKLRADEIAELGHQLEDFVLECSYDERICDLNMDFRIFQDETYGNCFQFNPVHNNSEGNILYSTKTGAKYGLKMTIFTEQDEYISVYGRDSGARVVIHPPHVPVIPQSEGLTVAPGKKFSLGIKENRIKREPHPYGNCSTIREYKSIYGDYYTITACEETCLQEKMFEHCGCVDTMFGNGTRCMQLNRTQDVCRQLIRYFGRKETIGCSCKQPCEETWYDTTVSQSIWPSNTYLGHLLKQIHSSNNKTGRINGLDQVSQNFLRLEVYFEELNYQVITESPAITEEVLLGSIGGTMGLYCGFSFITIVEFLQLFIELLRFQYVKYIRNQHL